MLTNKKIQNMKNVALALVTALGTSLTSIGCSPETFFGKSKDESVLKTTRYRKVNTSCAGMNLASATLDVPTFRSMLKCFNETGALEEVHQLINELKDQDLVPIVQVTNRLILENQKRLYEIERTYYGLDGQGLIDPSLNQVGILLENTQFISSAIKVLKAGFDKYNKEILQAIETVSKKMDAEVWRKTLDHSASLSSAPALKDLTRRFQGELPDGPDLHLITEKLYDYLKQKHGYKDELVHYLKTGELFDLATHVTGTSEIEIQSNVPKMVAMIQESLKVRVDRPEVYLMADLAKSFRYLNGEIKCMKEANTIPNGAMHVMREWLEFHAEDSQKYILKELPLTIVALNPFCDVPPELAETYPALRQLALAGALGPMTDVLKSVYRFPGKPGSWPKKKGQSLLADSNPDGPAHPFARFLVNLLGDKESTFENLLPAMLRLESLGAWGDLLLVMSSPAEGSQNDLKSAVSFLAEESVNIGGKSPLDVFLEALTASNPTTLYDFISNLKPYLDSKDLVLETALTTLRQAYHVNNVHPFLDLMQDIGGKATEHEDLFKTLFKIAESKKFDAALSRISVMAIDGSLKELTESTVVLFHKFAAAGAKKTTVIEQAPSALSETRRHQLRWAQESQTMRSFDDPAVAVPLELGQLDPQLEIDNQNCQGVNLRFALDKVNHPDFTRDLNAFLRCQNSGGNHKVIVDFIDFLRTHKTQDDVDFFTFQVQLTRDLVERPGSPSSALVTADLQYLIQSWIKSYDDEQFKGLIGAIPYWLGGPTAASSSVVRPLLFVVKDILSGAQEALTNLNRFGAQLLNRPDFTKILKDIDDLAWTERTYPEGTDYFDKIDFKNGSEWLRLKTWVESKECDRFTGITDSQEKDKAIELRVEEIIDETRKNVTNWNLVKSFTGTRDPRQVWTEEALQPLLRNRLFKMVRKAEKNIQASGLPGLPGLVDAQLNFLKSFSLSGKHSFSAETAPQHRNFPPEYLLAWLHPRSIDYRPITYFYDDEELPRVRYVNTLDLFELTLIDVDFLAPPFFKNLGLDFLSEIGEAWGDVDEREWPEGIRQKYLKLGKRPKRLFEAIRDIVDRHGAMETENLMVLSNKIMGLPSLPSCYKDVPNEPVDPRATAWISWPFRKIPLTGGEIKKIQRHLYNLHHVTATLLENVPVRPEDEAEMQRLRGLYPNTRWPAYGHGMEVLRNLFYEFHVTTPEKYQTSKSGDSNHLSAVQLMTRLGILRQLGRLMQNTDLHDPELKDFIYSVLHSAHLPEMKEIMLKLIDLPAGGGFWSSQGEGQELIWKILTDLLKITRNSGSQDSKTLQRMAYYSMVTMNRLDPWDPSIPVKAPSDRDSGLMGLLMRRVNQILSSNRDFLGRAPDTLIQDLLTVKPIADFMRAYYESPDVERDARVRSLLWDVLEGDAEGESKRVADAMEVLQRVYGQKPTYANWRRFQAERTALDQNEAYRKLKIKDSLRPILDFFEEEASSDRVFREDRELRLKLAQKIRSYGAELLEDGRALQLLVLLGENPEELARIMKELSPYLNKNDLKGKELERFFQMVRRSLSVPQH